MSICLVLWTFVQHHRTPDPEHGTSHTASHLPDPFIFFLGPSPTGKMEENTTCSPNPLNNFLRGGKSKLGLKASNMLLSMLSPGVAWAAVCPVVAIHTKRWTMGWNMLSVRLQMTRLIVPRVGQAVGMVGSIVYRQLTLAGCRNDLMGTLWNSVKTNMKFCTSDGVSPWHHRKTVLQKRTVREGPGI